MTRSLTIVQLLPQLNAGGVERGTLEINRALVASGHRSIVISGGGRMVSQLTSEGGEHLEMPIWKKSPLTLLQIPAMRKWMQAERPDVMHARSRVPAWVTWLAWRRLPAENRPRFMTTAHGMNKPNAYSRVMTYGETVVAVSNTCREYLLANYPSMDENRVEVIHRGVSPEEFPHGYTPAATWKDEWYERYPQLKGQFVACLPGRVTRFKGHLDFLQALANLKNRGVTVFGVIAGGEDPRRKAYSEELRVKIRELNLQSQVVFTGHRSDIKDVISICDVSISTSIRPPESFGRAVLESVRLGKITLGYAHGGVGEVLSTVFPDGCVPLQDIDRLANRIAAAKDGQIKPPLPGTEFSLATMQQTELSLYGRLCGPSAARRAA